MEDNQENNLLNDDGGGGIRSWESFKSIKDIMEVDKNLRIRIEK